jgi:uncharacterized protein
MHQVVTEKLPEIEALCRQLGIRRLDLFGSATGPDFNAETSDIYVLVEFDVGPEYDPSFDYVGSYFGLKEGLEGLFGRPVDVVSVTSIRNPYFRDEVMRTKEQLYAA